MLRGLDGAHRGGLRPYRALRQEAELTQEKERGSGSAGPSESTRAERLSGPKGHDIEQETWEAAFERKIRGGDVLGASDVLRGTGKEGWVRKAQHDRAAEIVDAIAPAPIVRRDWATRLLAHPRRVDRELAVAILLPLARSHARDLERAIERLREDTDPAVRRAVTRLERALASASEPR